MLVAYLEEGCRPLSVSQCTVVTQLGFAMRLADAGRALEEGWQCAGCLSRGGLQAIVSVAVHSSDTVGICYALADAGRALEEGWQ